MTPVGRTARVLAGLALVAVAFAMTVRAHLGLGPWHVVQQGLGRHAGIAIGTAGMVVNGALFAVALLLRERPGIATLGSVFLGNAMPDALLPHVPTPHGLALRVAVLVAALPVMSFGAALYLSASLGASPLDAVMTGIFRRVPWSLGAVRVGLEVTGFVIGAVAGGEIGVGCVVIGLGIGPGIQLWLRLLRAMPAKLPHVEAAQHEHHALDKLAYEGVG